MSKLYNGDVTTEKPDDHKFHCELGIFQLSDRESQMIGDVTDCAMSGGAALVDRERNNYLS